MAQSVVGEEVPNESIVSMIVDDDGRIMRVDAQQMAGGPMTGWPAGAGAKLATAWTSLTFPDAVRIDREAPLAGGGATVRVREPVFVLMDCGRWGGKMPVGGPSQRYFGVVWGPWAALCEYVPDGSCANEQNLISDQGTGKPVAGHAINELLVQLRGSGGASIRLVKAEWSPAPNPGEKNWKTDWETLYVVLPDLHLPVSVRPTGTAGSDGARMGRFEYCDKTRIADPSRPEYFYVTPDNEGMVTHPVNHSVFLGDAAQTWFKRYRDGDIFGLPDSPACRDLVDFCRRLSAAPLRSRIHFVQVGDMYDLWIGLIAFFDEQKSDRMVLGDRDGVRAGDFVDFWCDRTNKIFDATPVVDPAAPGGTRPLGMIAALTGVAVREKSFLWGNHDNYLAVHTPAGIPQRIREIRKNGVYIEHGQRPDPSNRDGTLSGHGTTNQVFKMPAMRAFDPTRRGYYTTGSAVAYAQKPDFGVYVMGHTHMPYLSKVRVRVINKHA